MSGPPQLTFVGRRMISPVGSATTSTTSACGVMATMRSTFTLPGIAVGLAASFLPGSSVAPLSAAAAAAGGWLAFAAVARVYRRTRGMEGLGQGDWKMAAMLGAFLGWQKMLLTVLLASVAGTVVGLILIALRGRDMRYALPFGTFLGVGAILVVFLGDPVLIWYRGLFDG